MAELLTIQNLILSGASLFLGALLSSYFSWLYFKKQMRAEIQIDEAKAIHKQIFNVNAQFAELHAMLRDYQIAYTTNKEYLGNFDNIDLFQKMNKLADELYKTSELFNYAKYILNVDTKAIATLHNDWALLVEDEYKHHKMGIERANKIREFIEKSVDFLQDESARIVYSSNANIYTMFQKLKYSLNTYKDIHTKRKMIPKWLDNTITKLSNLID
jgi:hypothetical protein